MFIFFSGLPVCRKVLFVTKCAVSTFEEVEAPDQVIQKSISEEHHAVLLLHNGKKLAD